MQKTSSLAIVFLLLLVISNAQSQEQPKNGLDDSLAVPRKAESGTVDIPVAEMPTTWFFMGQEFWYPNRFNMSESLQGARVHYRKGQLKAAQTEITEATTWLSLAMANADEKSKAELQTVIADLGDIATRLDGEKSVSAKELSQAFANANLALARHHFSKANKLAEQSDLVNASRRLIAAADHMKNAANSADIAPSPIIGTFRSEYSPYGMVDPESLELTPQQLKKDLEELAGALEKLGQKLKQRAE